MLTNGSNNQSSVVTTVRHVSAIVLVVSGVGFALLSVFSIWEIIDTDSDLVWRSLGSLAIIALASIIINLGAKIYGGNK